MKIPFNIPYINEKAKIYIKESLESLKHCGNHDFANRVIKLMQTNYNFKEIFLTSSCTTADVNSDGIIDILDIVQTINIAMGFMAPTAEQQCAADVNDDGIIDILDAIQIVQIIINP